MTEHAKPPFPKQKQPMPGKTDSMEPVPDHGEKSYRGSGRLAGKKAIITGADSGIGRAVAIAYAREGADVLIAYLNEHDDANQTERFVKDAGRKAAHSLTITSRQTLLLPAGGAKQRQRHIPPPLLVRRRTRAWCRSKTGLPSAPASATGKVRETAKTLPPPATICNAVNALSFLRSASGHVDGAHGIR
jgi:NAD(P)-dependent dehydrogenase (short-subunit alcohol dehydrogenase family)